MTNTTETSVSPFDELVTDLRVHRTMYTDPQIFVTEMNRVYGGTWTYLAHESEIPEPNDFVRRKLGLRPIIVTRDRNGEIHGLINRCTHRGATVCRTDSGNARSFMCPYHNWTFNNTGKLTGVPMHKGYGASFNRDELGLGRLRVDSYRGFIFGTLNQEITDLATHLGNVTDYIDQWLDRWPGAELVVRHGETRLNCKGNWKLIYDNSADGYHPGFSHASLLRMRKERYGVGVDMQWALGDTDAGKQTVTDLGNGNTFLDQRAEIDSYWDSAAPMPGQNPYANAVRAKLDDAAAKAALDVVVGSGMNLNIFPNLLIIGNQIQVIEPLAVADTDIVWYSTSLRAPDLPDEINSLRVRLQEDFPAFGEPDDLANFEECQVGLGVEEMEWVVTNRHIDTDTETLDANGNLTGLITDELPIRAFWRYWKKLMISDTKLVAR
ncbi:aromatic ring-hydroxylating oxygenase subunit alpha [Gordonia sp. 852002-50395_SCH5434458]|uniref:aromatic ring-hydroxylating oxygenase subunit alpha n=1 Tax=Gordonia sp. 852002-50395_SCH5434458 TaxID=1834090 RepID=UPI0007EAE4AE|nr:Rieske 2Fe-2S domain-containing protein [Gordonia sp. 852002-50395_SCH5434458]OBC04327.1 (2Fe-2S)-binding protein [Gordonia sp. 852002-50395_SCH5434458]